MRHLQNFRYIEAVMRAGSIRKAAEDMNITASALNRRIQRFEEEFGAEVFERLPRGVRLNPAGELLIQHYRAQASDLARVQSQVADLSGERRGAVTIGCSQALLPYFLPAEIAAYRREHPGVTFSVAVRDRDAAEEDLSTFRVDIALVFEPVRMVDFEVLMSIPQHVYAMMRADHPLAAAPGDLRLRDCLAEPHLIPDAQYGVRYLLDGASKRIGRDMAPIATSDSFDFMRHYVLHEAAVAFQLPIGLEVGDGATAGIAMRRVAPRDVPAGNLLLGQMRGRTLPVASARFAQRLAAAMVARAERDAELWSGGASYG